MQSRWNDADAARGRLVAPTIADRPDRIPALDGVRGIAVLTVVFYHAGALPGGWVGVNIFFALSGYLITRILLDARNTGAAPREILVPFYMRRALRILPLAVLVAAIVGVLTRSGWRTLWYVSYVQNWLPHPGPPWELGHYWSLAVEEQFYLVWPIVMLFIPRRTLVGACLSVVMLDALFRAALFHWQPAFAMDHILRDATPVRADPIAVGALIAVIGAYGGLSRFRRFLAPALVAAAVLFALAQRWQTTHTLRAYTVTETAIAAIIGILLAAILAAPPRWLSWSWLRRVGAISYGIYIIHNVIATWLGPRIASVPLRLVLILSLSVGLAELSWRYFEYPILRLKRHWPMPQSERG